MLRANKAIDEQSDHRLAADDADPGLLGLPQLLQNSVRISRRTECGPFDHRRWRSERCRQRRCRLTRYDVGAYEYHVEADIEPRKSRCLSEGSYKNFTRVTSH